MEKYDMSASAEYIGVSYRTLKDYEDKGKIIFLIEGLKRKYATQEMLDDYKKGEFDKTMQKYKKAELIQALTVKFCEEEAEKLLEYSNSKETYYRVKDSKLVSATDNRVLNIVKVKKDTSGYTLIAGYFSEVDSQGDIEYTEVLSWAERLVK